MTVWTARLSFLFAQWVSLRAIKHPLDVAVQHSHDRAIVVGPLRQTSIRTSIAVCHSGRSIPFAADQ
jgi:hypothetical protein